MNKNFIMRTFKPRLPILIILLFLGCSTQKDAALNRAYHKLNTKYNALFYAKEHLKTGVKKITELHTDNYKDILSINKYGTLKDSQSSQSSLDQAIEKSTLAIQQHSMDIDGEEKNKLIFQAYSVIGQAKFFKKEYLPAINTFNYIVRKSSDPEMQSEAALWSTRCHQQLNNKEAVQKNIQKLEDDYYLTKSQDAVLFEIKAELAIQEEDFVLAEKHLLRAIKLSSIKNKKTRMYFILGQIQLIVDSYENSLNSFQQVVKKNPKYELVFNAKLNQTRAYSPTLNNFESLKRDLNKMLKDKKNNEYQDQIYFALANMQLKNNDTISAIESLVLSARLSTTNLHQKTESHYALAELYWSKKKYINSYNHCDSAYQFAEPSSIKYNEIKKMLRDSKKVATLYTIIQDNDSIISLANLSDEERNQIIDQHISDLKKQEQESKLNNERGGSGNNSFNSYEYNKQTQNSMNITSSGGWYFYNPSAMSLGYSEFLSRWGNRKLEDNWRRKNKNQILVMEDAETDTLFRPPTDKEKYSREYYISQLPLEEQQQQILLSKIETAYYDLSGVFSTDLGEYSQSVQLYNELILRFPSTDYMQLVYFDLYNIYNITMDTVQAQTYLKKIETEYPNSNYIEILKGTVPINAQLENEKALYRKAYDLYVEFSEDSCTELQTLYQNNQKSIFIAEIELLNAFCQASKHQKKTFIENLEAIKAKHVETVVANKIDTILLTLKGDQYESHNTIFKKEFESPHYFFLLIRDINTNLPETQLAISNFNENNYKLDSLSTTNLLLNKEEQILRVGRFKNQLQAQTYYELIQESSITQEIFKNKDIIAIVISENNFSQLLKSRNINDYIEFFNKIYLLN